MGSLWGGTGRYGQAADIPHQSLDKWWIGLSLNIKHPDIITAIGYALYRIFCCDNNRQSIVKTQFLSRKPVVVW